MKPAVRCENITPFIVMEIMEKIHKMEKSGIDVIHMEIGEPDFNVPECVNQATVDALSANATHYTHSLGDIRLREAISQYHKTTYNTIIDPGQVLITSGTDRKSVV